MGCNCKTNKNILKFYKKYGYQSRVSWKERIHFTLEESIKFVLLALIVVFLSPIIIVVIIIKIIMGKGNFDINKILRFLLRTNKDE